jgi:hypothetical protein
MNYKLKGEASSRRVWLDDKELTAKRSQKHYNHSPDGFNWGYMGSGPAQLALAVLLEVNDDATGYQDFKARVIAELEVDKDFEIEFNTEC